MNPRFVPLLAGMALVVWTGFLFVHGTVGPRVAYACTAPTEILALDYFVEQADAIALVHVTDVGGATNETPPLPPGTPLDHPNMAGGSGIPEDFHFQGYRARAEVSEVIEGSLPAEIEIDRALRERMEHVVRQYEIGNRVVPCFFGFQQRYANDTSYLVFLKETDDGWETLRRYELAGEQLVLGVPGVVVSPQERPLIVSEAIYRGSFLDHAAVQTEAGTGEYGQLWMIEEKRVPLGTVKQAIAQLTGSSVTPPVTGSAGLR